MKIQLLELTRIKLALGHVLSAVVVSVLFSAIIYIGVMLSVRSSIQRAELRLGIGLMSSSVTQPSISVRQLQFLEDEFNRVQGQLLYYLLLLNGMVAVFTAVVSYFFAKETLHPVTQLMEQQKQFVANASHELKTPLTALKTSLEVALRAKTNTPKNTQLITSSLQDVERLEKIIQRLLILANQENSHIQRKHSDIFTAVERALAIVHPLAAQKNITLQLQNKHLFVYADQDALVEALVIVLDNAIKYSNTDTTISLRVSRFVSQVRITITDSGIGISPKDIPHIFERFYRGSESRNDSGKQGFGIGLAIVQQIMQNHDGSIQLKSTLGAGTTVTLKLPITLSI